MAKGLAKYILYLSILLVSGYCVLSAPANRESGLFTQVSLLKSPPSFENGAPGSLAFNHTTPTSGTSSKNLKLVVAENEVEEEELTSSKRHVEITNSFVTLFHTQASEYFHNYTKNRIALFTHTYCPPSDLYLELEVFRL